MKPVPVVEHSPSKEHFANTLLKFHWISFVHKSCYWCPEESPAHLSGSSPQGAAESNEATSHCSPPQKGQLKCKAGIFVPEKVEHGSVINHFFGFSDASQPPHLLPNPGQQTEQLTYLGTAHTVSMLLPSKSGSSLMLSCTLLADLISAGTIMRQCLGK